MNVEIKKMVIEHADMRSYLIGVDEIVDYKRLFDPVLLESTTSLEQLYVFDRTLTMLVACGEIDLEHAGISDEGLTLYRRTD